MGIMSKYVHTVPYHNIQCNSATFHLLFSTLADKMADLLTFMLKKDYRHSHKSPTDIAVPLLSRELKTGNSERFIYCRPINQCWGSNFISIK